MRTYGSFILDEKYLLNRLKDAASLLGGYVSGRDMAKLTGFPSRSVYEQRFGCWSNAIKLAGLKLKSPGPKKQNKQKTKNTGAPFKLRFSILERDNFTCQYCGRTPQDGAKLCVDHIIPFKTTKKDDINNLITSCFECNIGKGDIIFESLKKKADRKSI